jgi:integrase
MQAQPTRPASGHVYRRARARGDQWYVKYRLPNGRQVQKRLGAAWTSRGRPADGYYTKATAEAELRRILAAADRGELGGTARTGATFADAADEWLRFVEHEGGRRGPVKPTTLSGYRSAARQLKKKFGDTRLEQVTPAAVEAWRRGLLEEGQLSRRSINKMTTNLHGIFVRAGKVWGIPNPVALEGLADPPAGRLDFYSSEEVYALARAADELARETLKEPERGKRADAQIATQDGALFITAAFTGLRRGELVALRWRDVDFEHATIRVEESYSAGHLTRPKSNQSRSVPMVPQVAELLARVGQRETFTNLDDRVFVGKDGAYLDASALRRRYKKAQARAGLRELRFHDLRHVFGSLMINHASIVEVQEWMGHADIDTTRRYLHYKSKAGRARELERVFATKQPPITA